MSAGLLIYFRQAIRFLRCRIEGVFFLLMFPALLFLILIVFLAVCLKIFSGSRTHMPKEFSDKVVFIIRRWGIFILTGLTKLRETWWPTLSLERMSDVWRYVILFEIVELWNLSACGKRRAEPDNMENVLVVKLGHLGDVLHIVPMLRSLRSQMQNGNISLLVGPWCQGLVEEISYIDGYTSYCPRWRMFNREKEPSLHFVQELLFFWRLRSAGCSLLISTSTMTYVDYFILHAINPVRWIGVDPATDLYGPAGEAHAVSYDSSRYEAERVSALLELVDLKAGTATLEYMVNKGAESFADEFVREYLKNDNRLVVVAPGAGWEGKIWPPEKFAQLVDRLIGTYHVQIVLIGSPKERELAKKLLQASEATLINMVGETTFSDAAALIARSALFIGNDSAPLHLAAALKCPTLSLFGATKVEQWAPKGEQNRVLKSHAVCPGCYPWHPKVRCQYHPDCIQAISVRDAFAVASDLLNYQTLGRGH